MPLYFIPIPHELLQLATAFTNSANNSSLYFYKDTNGNIQSSNTENIINANNVGYAYQFINGDVVYSAVPITNYNDIQFIYPGLTTIPSLWADNLTVWLDASDARTVSAAQQKLVSKSYGAMSFLVENTTGYSFTTTASTIECVNNSNIETSLPVAVQPYFSFALIFKIDPTKLSNNNMIFQHNRLIIKLSSNLAADNTTQLLIALFDNSTFIAGLELSPNTGPLYYVFANSNGDMYVNNILCNQTKPTFNFSQTTSQKLYLSSINGQSTISSNLSVYELMYFTSATNNCPTKALVDAYLTAKYTSINVYTPLHNTPLRNVGFNWLLSQADPYWAVLNNVTVSTTAFNNYGSANNNLTITPVPAIYQKPSPLFPGNCLSQLHTSQLLGSGVNKKWYYEMSLIEYADPAPICGWTIFEDNTSYNTAADGYAESFYFGSTTTLTVSHLINGTNSSTNVTNAYLGSNAPMTAGVAKNIGFSIDYSALPNIVFSIFFNGAIQYSATYLSTNNHVFSRPNGFIMPCFATGNSFASFITSYIPRTSATMIPANFLYVE